MFAVFKHAAVELYRRNPVLTTFAALAASGLPLMAVACTFDTRLVTGLNPWIKPMKFTASFAVYFATFGWLLSYLPRPRRAVRVISWVTGLCVLLEAPVLVLQAARGVTSHFNNATPLDATLFGMMGVGAFTQMVTLAWALVLFCTRKVELPRLPLQGIRAGLALWLLGIVPGIAMLMLGGHNVGVADGGPGLPLLNWSTLGGDLRIAHFLGLHAIQVLPLAGLVLYRLAKAAPERRLQVVFTLFVAGYALAMIAAFAQAMAGMPLVALN